MATAKNLAPNRVRCMCCKKSMARAKNPMRSRLTGRIIHVHYACLSAHVSSMGRRCENKRFHG